MNKLLRGRREEQGANVELKRLSFERRIQLFGNEYNFLKDFSVKKAIKVLTGT